MLTEEIRGAAFRRLLRTSSAATIEELAADLGRPAEDIGRRVHELDRLGRIRLDDGGRVARSAGLSIGARPAPDRRRRPEVLDLVCPRRPRHLRRAPCQRRGAVHRPAQQDAAPSPIPAWSSAAGAGGPVASGRDGSELLRQRLRGVVSEQQLLRGRGGGADLVERPWADRPGARARRGGGACDQGLGVGSRRFAHATRR